MGGTAHGCFPRKAGTSMTKPTINPGRSHQELVDDRATISSRKDDHVRLAARIRSQEVEPYQLAVWDELDQCEFIHQALPEIAVDQVDISSTVAGIAQSSPFFINAMTGGTVGTNALNSQLAAVASRTGVAMALGSMSILVKKPEVQGFYRTLRKDNPNVNFIANLGAEHSVEAAQLVVETVDAQALQLHLNAAQEIVMPEGSRDFRGWTDHIGRIVDAMDKKGVPVIVKEVGFGLSRETVERLYSLGVRWVDLAGKGERILSASKMSGGRKRCAASAAKARLEMNFNYTVQLMQTPSIFPIFVPGGSALCDPCWKPAASASVSAICTSSPQGECGTRLTW